MSSEESEYEEVLGDDGERTQKKKGFKVRGLLWERTKLTNIKKLLDDEHKKTLTAHALSMTLPRTAGHLSKRPRPKNAPTWAVHELPQ